MEELTLEQISDLHLPVLAQECLTLLSPALQGKNTVLVDGTLGMGGHAKLILETFPNVSVIGIDRDQDALAIASRRLEKYGNRFTPVHSTYDQILEIVGSEKADAILLDLGVSSFQLDMPSRGFSYSRQAPLDMRMDQSATLSAFEVVNEYSLAELFRVIRDYGEERFAQLIAKNIVKQREEKTIDSTLELAELIANSIPRAVRQKNNGHPAKRTFQAIRIEVNQELAVLERTIPAAIETLKVGGRLVVEAYQSLEDRIVKRDFQRGATSNTPLGLPVELSEHSAYLKLLTKGAIKADDAELERNLRAKPVRLRAVQKILPTTNRLELLQEDGK